ncbi:MAG TPA: hypothetical protein VF618_16730 [Thermoanaerobaculia bacterium]
MSEEHGAPLFPEAKRRHRVYRGLNERQEHIFTWIAVIVILLFMTAWVGGTIETTRLRRAAVAKAKATGQPVVMPPAPTRQITAALTEPGTPATAYINDALLGFLNPLRGESGELRFTPVLPGETVAAGAPGEADAVLSQGEARQVSPDFVAPQNPGIYKLAVQMRQATRVIDDLNVVTLVPLSKKRGGKIGLYYLGVWPWEQGGTPRSERYAPPRGFIEVTQQNQNTRVSEHFRLRDFLTKDQRNVWPKYLLLDEKLIDKLELTIQELERQGVRVDHVFVMSGFRTPRYNHSSGNTAGRANLSRHMYGDAADVYVDNNRDGYPDDITGDGRVDTRDAQRFADAAERVERQHRSLVGGIGVYSACCGHGPFTHIDVRGLRARWRGTGNG